MKSEISTSGNARAGRRPGAAKDPNPAGRDRPPGASDRALLRAWRAWGGGSDFARASSRFSPRWRDRLRAAWGPAMAEKPEAAWSQLRLDHEASCRPDPGRIHPSWFLRALKGESQAVRLAVVAHAPPGLREPLRRGLGIDPTSFATDFPPDPEALGWALALWSERLVGDVPERDDDPPVVVGLTRLGPTDLARLVKVCGLVKHAFAIEGPGPSPSDESIARFTPLDRVRLAYFRRHIGAADPRLVPQAQLDLAAIGGDRRRAHARVGLVTFGRLLGPVEPHRSRWAMQHIPYPVARLMREDRALNLSARSAASWETWVMEAAWARLFSEGRLTTDRGRSPGANATAGPGAEARS